jgi:hypothetical protein
MTGVGLDGRPIELDEGEDLGHRLEEGQGGLAHNPRNDPNPFENLTIHDLMVRMRRGLVEDLLDRLESKTATHQELAIIQRMLNDAGYVVDRSPTEEAEAQNQPTPKSDLPDFGDQDYDT